MSEGCVCVCSTVKAVLDLCFMFSLNNCVNMNVDGVNNTT